MNNFKPAWWLPGPHLQTLMPAILRRKVTLVTTKQRLELADGDFLDLCWLGSGNGPLVLILHGLNGGINSPYINGMLHAIEQHGWRGVLMHFRGCSGEPNRLERSYHSGETGDLYEVLSAIQDLVPNTPIFVVGYSLGGNVLLKALGEHKMPLKIKGAVAVSIPFELAKTAAHLNKGFSRIYQWRLVGELKKSLQLKFKTINSSNNFRDLKKLHTFWDFDNKITGPLHGFKGADDYYQQSSSRQYLAKIQIPTLILHALDDPFTTLNSLPNQAEVSTNVRLEFSANGGHVGFVSGKYPWRPIYWLESRILNYFDSLL